MSGPSPIIAAARDLQAQGRDVVRLDIGEPDFPTPPHIVEAGVRALRDGATRYVAPAGIAPLRAALADALRARGVPASPDGVVVTAGARPMLLFALLALVRSGDEVLVPDPGYPAYTSAARLAGGRAVPYPLATRDGAFRVDVEAVRAALSPRTRVLVLNAPHNPTGAVLDDGTLAELAELARRHDLWVVSDEVYAAFAFDGPSRSIAALPGMRARTVMVDSFSKTYAMTGWRLGFGVMPETLAPAVTTLVADSTTCAPAFVQHAGLAALAGPRETVDMMRTEYRRRRDLLVAGLRSVPGVRVARPAGAFYAFADVSTLLAAAPVTGATAWLAERLLHAYGLACLPGSAFGARGAGALRFSFASTPDRLNDAVARLARCAAELPSGSAM
ncbi:MAG TPA: pyridoxal phosphate-dependent aminotransferase [Gemmatimonadaceae bacterium]|nr:pyridoxal phosphate-dependent aminotransferase [Gemmatimonadaceae bacterium]